MLTQTAPSTQVAALIADTSAAGPRAARGAPSWHAPAAWGAGLIEIALGAGAIIAPSSVVATRAAGIVLITLGLAALLWGGFSLASARLIVPRTAVAGSLGGIALLTVALALDPVRTSIFAVATASVLLIAVALAAVAALRRSRRGRADAASPRITELIVAAVVVAALVTPALSATEAGRLAPDHGAHSVMDDPSHH